MFRGRKRKLPSLYVPKPYYHGPDTDQEEERPHREYVGLTPQALHVRYLHLHRPQREEDRPEGNGEPEPGPAHEEQLPNDRPEENAGRQQENDGRPPDRVQQQQQGAQEQGRHQGNDGQPPDRVQQQGAQEQGRLQGNDGQPPDREEEHGVQQQEGRNAVANFYNHYETDSSDDSSSSDSDSVIVVEDDEEDEDFNVMLDKFSNKWLAAESDHTVSKTAVEAFWKLAFEHIPKMMKMKERQGYSAKIPQFQQIRRKMNDKLVPDVELQIGYRNKSTEEVTEIKSKVTPKSRFPTSDYEKVYEIASVKVRKLILRRNILNLVEKMEFFKFYKVPYSMHSRLCNRRNFQLFLSKINMLNFLYF